MLREAAYLGVPAYSLFQGELGGVDRQLMSLGRLQLLSSEGDFERILLAKAGPLSPLDANPHLVEELADRVISRVEAPRRMARSAGAD